MPISLTNKERMLLEDQKSHELICINKYTNYSNQTKNTQLKQIFNANAQAERTHLDSIHQLLSGNLPQTNQQNSGGQNMGNQMNNAQVGGTMNISDADMCKDILMTEKYVSGAYDTAIFEFRDTGARDVLNHIQKEEQKHGEAVYKFMESNGMYSVQ